MECSLPVPGLGGFTCRCQEAQGSDSTFGFQSTVRLSGPVIVEGINLIFNSFINKTNMCRHHEYRKIDTHFDIHSTV